jgi:hypothetical protein
MQGCCLPLLMNRLSREEGLLQLVDVMSELATRMNRKLPEIRKRKQLQCLWQSAMCWSR